MKDEDSINQINKDIKKDYKSLRNRLQSILLDNRFLKEKVVPFFPNYPLIPNERCGLWYCDPKDFEQTSYFKSTDGHINQWDFSTRRLNFHLLPTLKKHGGIIIVDSTRRGKKIPDALSKTVPIWCAVLNYIMLKSMVKFLTEDGQIDKNLETDVLFVPPSTVPKSEFERMKQKIPLLEQKLEKLNIVDGRELYKQFNGKLLRPIWVHPGSSLLESSIDPFTGEYTYETWETPEDEDIIPIILCTASYQAQDGVDKRHGFTYVQGAADDHELWSQGLDTKMFWANIDNFGDSDISEEVLKEYVADMIKEKLEYVSQLETEGVFPRLDRITDSLYLGKIVDGLQIGPKLLQLLNEKYSAVVILSETCTIIDTENKEKNSNIDSNVIHLFNLQSGSKRSSKELRRRLQNIYPVIEKNLPIRGSEEQTKPVLICCNSGTDMSIGVLLTVLCKNYNDDWTLQKPDSMNKIIIRKQLTHLISHLKGRNVNPSRATLNSVNSFLM